MRKLYQRLILSFGCLSLTFGSFCFAQGQTPPQVYNPNTYSNNRMLMNRRAAIRYALKKKRQKAAKKRYRTIHKASSKS